MLDIQVTQGSYWKGAQIPYFVYIILTIFTGLLGLDHLALRSPLTAALKVLSIVPLLGFWYFYDIAQALGERDNIEKFGIAVPFYGPTGIGAGMFSGTKDIPEAPKDIPGPWKYLFYVLTTCIFIVFPINKFVLGDYMSGIVHILMYILFPLTFIAIAWSFYDVYQALFRTKDIFENGVPRMTPASMLVGERFRRNALGPYPPSPPPPPTWFQRLFTAWMEVPIVAAKAASTSIDLGTKATVGIASVVEGEVENKVHEAASVASQAIQTAKVASNAVSGTVAEGAKAAEGTAALLQKIPAIGEKVASEMGDPSKLIDAAKKSIPQVPALPQVPSISTQAGGALVSFTDLPSVSTSVLLFSVALVAFSGYVFYSMRNTYKKPEKSDDPPREPATVRGSSKPSE